MMHSNISSYLGRPTVRNLSGLSENCIACPEIEIGSFRTLICPENWKEWKILKLRLLCYNFYDYRCHVEGHSK